MTEWLSELRRRPLGEIPVARAVDVTRTVLRHRDDAEGGVEVARFGSVA
ncbi:hypothetical protein [Verrucosispora sioxanthis]|uniref:Uncharacterized protein n=2 Tax=Micromonosporaceae TaxID=28056 RepID=A0A6M1L9Y2_9ACTN|nr:hypothetical protein [Verrucosispora sioxanthis]NEE65962.1 hypothetical protein [Verrucosispora sioxanthis]NGM15072.1 hypothetical protein [Verrucosispora sioxanthis]